MLVVCVSVHAFLMLMTLICWTPPRAIHYLQSIILLTSILYCGHTNNIIVASWETQELNIWVLPSINAHYVHCGYLSSLHEHNPLLPSLVPPRYIWATTPIIPDHGPNCLGLMWIVVQNIWSPLDWGKLICYFSRMLSFIQYSFFHVFTVQLCTCFLTSNRLILFHS